MGNEFSGLPMHELIGGPLTAACDAQVKLALATSDFINTVGFDKNGVIRQVDFSFWRPTKKANQDATAPGATPAPDDAVELVKLSVPFLAIVNIPALKIKSVDITFDMEVKSSESSTDSSKKDMGFEAEAGGSIGPFEIKAKINGSISTAKENTRKTDKSAKYHVEVHALDEGMPEGLSRVMDILQGAIAPYGVDKALSAKEAKAKPVKEKPAAPQLPAQGRT